MSEFGDFSGTPSGGAPPVGDFGDFSDPTADFLAREKALLGDDAALFGNHFDGPVQSSGVPDFASATPGPIVEGFATDAFDSQPGFSSELNAAAAMPLPFEHTGASSQNSFDATSATSNAFPAEPEVEPEVIREWRASFQALIADRDAKSQSKQQELLRNAKESLERFYAEYNEKKAKSVARNKDQETKAIADRDDTTSGTVWDRVVKQIEQVTQTASGSSTTKGKVVDLNKGRLTTTGADAKADKSKDANKNKETVKVRDTARMKQLLMSLRKDPNAPGVKAAA
ncbi:clathrin light chain-domain-containing protein [Fimicolochytrium jonesii]|uniref:clathrin light chain-domain-containing protein n=1 Tax=Fimicolochytrium jonesii TaxID=1396493 RepID=UPI0022FDD70E|nr:clathrin light chain-domain-containing protein [Fimicolochytrium jonesii]KAI8816708.1 clathrin light chain-domain-containing protein [Fimicolochytrium jonesii]